MVNIDELRDVVEIDNLRQENKALKEALAEWVEMAENGLLCCPCNSKRKACKECGIKQTEKASKKLLKAK
jgi:hypothetical protein